MVFPRPFRISATGNGNLGGVNSALQLWTVNVNTGAASAVLTLYDGQSTAGTEIAVIDASAPSAHGYYCVCKDGLHWVLSGGNADITISYA